jgi:hypothetical protein
MTRKWLRRKESEPETNTGHLRKLKTGFRGSDFSKNQHARKDDLLVRTARGLKEWTIRKGENDE